MKARRGAHKEMLQPLFWAEIAACFFIAAGMLLMIRWIGPRFSEAIIQPDQQEALSADIPFYVPDIAEYFDVRVDFTLAPLHATHLIIAPDDCVEVLMVNNELIPAAQGKCGYHAGHAFALQNLKRGMNSLYVRVHNTGGPGGLDVRVAYADPLFFSIIILLLLSLSWAASRIIRLFTQSRETSLLPFVIAVALLLRMFLIWHDGHGSDLHLNKEWGLSAMRLGIVESYTRQVDPGMGVPNYPPLNIVAFATGGLVYELFAEQPFDPDSPASHAIIKLPAIAADLVTIIVLFALLIPLGGRRKALAAVALYAIHPAIIHDSAVWGQTDALFTLFMCLALLSLQKKWWFAAGCMLGTALLFKAQALVMLPVLAAAGDVRWRRWLSGAAGGLVAALLVLSPFLLQGATDKILDMYQSSVGYYTSLSLNAHNVWVMLYTNDTGRDSTQLFFNLVSYRTFGIVVWCVFTVIAWLLWRRSIQDDIRTGGRRGMLMLFAAFVAYAFFMFNAEMHERYLFPYLALGLPLLLTGPRGIMLYIAASLLFLLNLIALTPFGEFDKWLFHQEFGKALPVVVATGQTIVFFMTWRHIHRWQRLPHLRPLWPRLRKKFMIFYKRIQLIR